MLFSNPIDRLHRLIQSFVYIFVVWGLYRLIFRLPEPIEEIIFKPLVFVGAVILVERPKSWQKFFWEIWGAGDWVRAAFFGLLLGIAYMVFYAAAGLISAGGLILESAPAGQSWELFLGLGLVTAVWEEWTFTGYILKGLSQIMSNKWLARSLTAALFALVHLPALIFWHKFTGSVIGFQLFSLMVLGFGNAILMGYSKNLLAPIISHTLWGAAIFLFASSSPMLQ